MKPTNYFNVLLTWIFIKSVNLVNDINIMNLFREETFSNYNLIELT